MKTSCSSRLLQLLLGAALAVAPIHSAWANTFHVHPVRLELSAKTRTTLVSIDNPGPEPMRLQISLYAWSQDAQGKAVLTPTQELSFFPSLLTVEPGQSRNIRIGGQLPAQATERTFRVIVEQLPPLTSTESPGVQLRMLTRMSIPLFVAPSQEQVRGRVEALALEHGKISFSLRNAGNRHVFANKARVRAQDQDGETVLDQEQAGWYVLAGDERVFSLPVPSELCKRLRTLSVEVSTDSGSFPAQATLTGSGCET